MGRDSTSSPVPVILNIDVVSIMPSEPKTEEFVDEVISNPDVNVKFHCHSLYYDDNEFKNGKFVFSGTYPELLMK